MNSAISKNRFRLAAIDLDGTLLSPDLSVSNENLRAIETLRERKLEIVIASGRHYNSIAQFLKILPDVQWVVSVQGGEVSNRERSQILSRIFLKAQHVRAVVEQGMARGLTPIVYSIDGIFTPAADNSHLKFYRRLSGLNPRQIPFEESFQMDVFKVIWIGEPSEIDKIVNEGAFAPGVERVRTHHEMVEFMPASVSKATGLQILADHLGIAPNECMVFGDADNDLPMFEWAGLAVCMYQGWASAKSAADIVCEAGAPETSLARGIEAVIKQW